MYTIYVIISILQWNIWYQENTENTIKTLNEINPDIFCLQELTTTSLINPNVDVPELIAHALNVQHSYKEAQSWDSSEEKRAQGNGIFSKFPITKTHSSFLQDPSENPIDFSKEGRVYVETTIDVHGRNLSVGTLHSSYTDRFVNTEAKEKEIEKLIQILKTKKENYIFAGDLNASPRSETVQAIEKYLKNLGPSFERKTWTTKPFSKNGFAENGLNWRLDYIFGTNDIRVKHAEIIQTQFSDHLPILATIEL